MRFEEIHERLSRKCVGIAGAGGLGSNCAAALVRVGTGRLIIADFDTVTEGNLNRQFYFAGQVGRKKVEALRENLLSIRPDTIIEAMDTVVSQANVLSLFAGCDVIVEAFDLAEMKAMLIETVLEKLPEMPLVCGVGMAGWGDSASIGCRKEGNLYICGDMKTETGETTPPLAPRVGIVANMQANIVLEILLQ